MNRTAYTKAARNAIEGTLTASRQAGLKPANTERLFYQVLRELNLILESGEVPDKVVDTAVNRAMLAMSTKVGS